MSDFQTNFNDWWLSYLPLKLPRDECHGTLLMVSQHWFRLWLGAVRQQAITWTNVDPDLCHHMVHVLLGHNDLSCIKVINTNILLPFNSLWSRDTLWYNGSRSTLVQVMACFISLPEQMLTYSQRSSMALILLTYFDYRPVNSLWPSDDIGCWISWSTMVQVMACCLTAPSHYLNQCWLIISEVQWHSYYGNFTRDASTINYWNLLENCMSKISQRPMS